MWMTFTLVHNEWSVIVLNTAGHVPMENKQGNVGHCGPRSENNKSRESLVDSARSSSGLQSQSDVTVIENKTRLICDKSKINQSAVRSADCQSNASHTVVTSRVCNSYVTTTTSPQQRSNNATGIKYQAMTISKRNPSRDKERHKARYKHTVSRDSEARRSDFGEYYPDGGWGWVITGGALVVNCICYGLHLAAGSVYLAAYNHSEAVTSLKISGTFGVWRHLARERPRILRNVTIIL